MSAQANAAGMFPPSGQEIWNNELNWQPIPIHTKNPTEDYVLGDPGNCPKFYQLFKQFTESSEFKYENKKNSDFFKFLEKNSGMSNKFGLLIQILKMEMEKGFV